MRIYRKPLQLPPKVQRSVNANRNITLVIVAVSALLRSAENSSGTPMCSRSFFFFSFHFQFACKRNKMNYDPRKRCKTPKLISSTLISCSPGKQSSMYVGARQPNAAHRTVLLVCLFVCLFVCITAKGLKVLQLSQSGLY